LGMLGSGQFASGFTLDKAKAEAALTKIAARMGSDTQTAAVGIIRIACASCANAIREITVEQGTDPRKLKLLAFGGAGPLLATQMARELAIPTVLVPPFAGNFSAWGLLGSDLVRSTARTQRIPLTGEGLQVMNRLIAGMFQELESRGQDQMSPRPGVPELRIGLRHTGGQEHHLMIAVPWKDGGLAWDSVAIERAFRDAYQKIFGVTLENEVEAIVMRAAVRTPLERKIKRSVGETASSPSAAPSHQVYSFARGTVLPTKTLYRNSLRADAAHKGPAIIYEDTATTFVDADYTYRLDETDCLVLRREE